MTDVVIIGGGLVGLSTALSLAIQNPNLNISIIESKILSPSEKLPSRVFAINAASIKFLKNLNSWDEDSHSVYRKMAVWDDTTNANIDFDSAEIAEPYLGYICENSLVQKKMLLNIKNQNNIKLYCPNKVVNLEKNKNYIKITLDNNTIVKTKLLIGADGANSWLRKELYMSLIQKPYGHIALTAVVQTEKSHNKTAYQCFMPSGPLAFLPLKNKYQCSIVWSCEDEIGLNNLENKLNYYFKNQLGHIKLLTQPITYPLAMRHLENYVSDRVAFVGDAAHTIHPMAGLGVNLGFLDAENLANIITKNYNNKLDIGDVRLLKKYEINRKSHNQLIIDSMAGLKLLFSAQPSFIQIIRKIGLNSVNKIKPIKHKFMREAMGLE